MQSVLNAFESLLGDDKTSGECLEVPPGKEGGEKGFLIKKNVEYTNKESEVHAGFSVGMHRRMHDVVEG